MESIEQINQIELKINDLSSGKRIIRFSGIFLIENEETLKEIKEQINILGCIATGKRINKRKDIIVECTEVKSE